MAPKRCLPDTQGGSGTSHTGATQPSPRVGTPINCCERLRDLFRDGRAWRAADMADMAESARTGEECSVTTFQASLLSLLRDLCRQAQVLMETPTIKHYGEFVSMLAPSTVNLSGKGAD